MSVFVIPLQGISESFEITLGGIDYSFAVKWNDSQDAGWELDIYDAESNDPIVLGLPLITGANCLEGLDYLGFQGQLVVFTDGDENAVPTFDNLGTESNLYFITEDA